MSNQNIKLKVCGMRDRENIAELSALQPDYMGFIFYKGSKRFVDDQLDENQLIALNKKIKKVGVFVNATRNYILKQVDKYHLDYVQLHGDETAQFCKELKSVRWKHKAPNSQKIVKVFRVDQHFDFNQLTSYQPYCDFFMFETKLPLSPEYSTIGSGQVGESEPKGWQSPPLGGVGGGLYYGGTGIAFDWKLLEKYNNKVPFFLSGGISLENINQIKNLKRLWGSSGYSGGSHLSPQIHAVDINSRFEIAPGLKDIARIKRFKKLLDS
ncbi:MAG: phosphoribosylanthranilate isomerase [Bacteroidetes bacterium]|nr:phosphoribosylanthranilate isomerase [Bacteroidota bacterium]